MIKQPLQITSTVFPNRVVLQPSTLVKNEVVLGLVSVSFRQHTPREIIEAAKQVGLMCIEWGSDIHAPCLDTERLHEIAELQREYDVSCSSYGTYFRLGVTPIAELTSYLTAARLLGTRVLRLWCGDKSGAVMSPEERERLVHQCRLAAMMAEKSGVTLCLECHRDTFTECCDDAVALMEDIGSPHFKMYWQPFQWKSTEENVRYAQRIAPYTQNLHVFNWSEDARSPLAQAIDDWRTYLKSFTQQHALLLEFMPNDSLDELPGEVAALRAIVGEDQ